MKRQCRVIAPRDDCRCSLDHQIGVVDQITILWVIRNKSPSGAKKDAIFIRTTANQSPIILAQVRSRLGNSRLCRSVKVLVAASKVIMSAPGMAPASEMPKPTHPLACSSSHSKLDMTSVDFPQQSDVIVRSQKHLVGVVCLIVSQELRKCARGRRCGVQERGASHKVGGQHHRCEKTRKGTHDVLLDLQ
jgi:hypothetical protein